MASAVFDGSYSSIRQNRERVKLGEKFVGLAEGASVKIGTARFARAEKPCPRCKKKLLTI